MPFRKPGPLDEAVELQMEAIAHLNAALCAIKRANQIVDTLAHRSGERDAA